MWIPYSPTAIKNWSPWIKRHRFKNDLLVQTLNQLSIMAINYESQYNPMNITGGSLPLINIMQLSEYGKAVPNLCSKGIMFLD